MVLGEKELDRIVKGSIVVAEGAKTPQVAVTDDLSEIPTSLSIVVRENFCFSRPYFAKKENIRGAFLEDRHLEAIGLIREGKLGFYRLSPYHQIGTVTALAEFDNIEIPHDFVIISFDIQNKLNQVEFSQLNFVNLDYIHQLQNWCRQNPNNFADFSKAWPFLL